MHRPPDAAPGLAPAPAPAPLRPPSPSSSPPLASARHIPAAHPRDLPPRHRPNNVHSETRQEIDPQPQQHQQTDHQAKHQPQQNTHHEDHARERPSERGVDQQQPHDHPQQRDQPPTGVDQRKNGDMEHPRESRPQESGPQESGPQESRPQESRPQESRPQESRPHESRPRESRKHASAVPEPPSAQPGYSTLPRASHLHLPAVNTYIEHYHYYNFNGNCTVQQTSGDGQPNTVQMTQPSSHAHQHQQRQHQEQHQQTHSQPPRQVVPIAPPITHPLGAHDSAHHPHRHALHPSQPQQRPSSHSPSPPPQVSALLRAPHLPAPGTSIPPTNHPFRQAHPIPPATDRPFLPRLRSIAAHEPPRRPSLSTPPPPSSTTQPTQATQSTPSTQPLHRPAHLQHAQAPVLPPLHASIAPRSPSITRDQSQHYYPQQRYQRQRQHPLDTRPIKRSRLSPPLSLAFSTSHLPLSSFPSSRPAPLSPDSVPRGADEDHRSFRQSRMSYPLHRDPIPDRDNVRDRQLEFERERERSAVDHEREIEVIREQQMARQRDVDRERERQQMQHTTNSSSPSGGEYSLFGQMRHDPYERSSVVGGVVSEATGPTIRATRSADESQSNDWEAVVEMYTTGKGTEDGVALKMITKGDGRRVSDRKLLEKRRTIGKTHECLGAERFERAIGYKWENGVRRKQKMYHVISRCRVVNAMRKAGEAIPSNCEELTRLINERIAEKEALKAGVVRRSMVGGGHIPPRATLPAGGGPGPHPNPSAGAGADSDRGLMGTHGIGSYHDAYDDGAQGRAMGVGSPSRRHIHGLPPHAQTHVGHIGGVPRSRGGRSESDVGLMGSDMRLRSVGTVKAERSAVDRDEDEIRPVHTQTRERHI